MLLAVLQWRGKDALQVRTVILGCHSQAIPCRVRGIVYRPVCARETFATVHRGRAGWEVRRRSEQRSLYLALYMQSVRIILCFICKVSLLCSALYAKCPYCVVLYMQGVLIM